MRKDDLALLEPRLQEIKQMGWIKNQRHGNAGGVGNTLEDLLKVSENNRPAPDFGAWELKSQRAETGALLTLFHREPSPRKPSIVSRILLPRYGWPLHGDGAPRPEEKRSFRQTINATSYSDRGFTVNVDWETERVFVSFDYERIDDCHAQWRDFIRNGAGTGAVNPTPYWTFEDISKKLSKKLKNLIYISVQTKRIDGVEHFRYNRFEAYADPTLERFLDLVEAGVIYVDFDARTGHNHGTKFRIKPAAKGDLYRQHIIV